MTDNLDSAAKQRLETFAKREKQLDAVGVAHKSLWACLNPRSPRLVRISTRRS